MTQDEAMLLNLGMRIVSLIVVVQRAKSRNRTTWLWGIFAFLFPIPVFIAIWFVGYKKGKPAPAPQSLPTQSNNAPPSTPTLRVAPAFGTPVITKLNEIDHGTHRLVHYKMSSPISSTVLVLTKVFMPKREYEDLVISLGYGRIAEERATINQLVQAVFTNRTNGLRVFGSEAEYRTFIGIHFPGHNVDADNSWFHTVAIPLSASTFIFDWEATNFLDQQSRTYYLLRKPTEKLHTAPQPTAPKSTVRLTPAKKADWSAFQKLLRDHNITKLYHFTDRANLDSIRSEGGLLSWYSCKQRGIDIPRPGGSSLSWELDSGKGLADYVRLSFTRSHPMMHVALNDGRISAPVVLEIDPEVIFWESTKFTTANAAKSGVRATSSFDSFSGIDFSLFNRRYFDLSVDDKSRYQAEVLINQMLPASHILNLAQVST